MKKIISSVLVCVMLIGCLFTLASCGKKLSGTYSAGGDLAGTSYTFSGSNVTITLKIAGFTRDIEGNYKIEDNDKGETVITFSFEAEGENSDEAAKHSGSFAFSEGEEDGKDYIKIGGVKYTKK